MAALKRYAWEMEEEEQKTHSWEDEQPGLQAWNSAAEPEEEGDSESEEEQKPGEALLAFLLAEHFRGAMTAKQVCIVSHYAGLGGMPELKPYGLSPETKSSGDFKRLLDRRAKAELPDCYEVPTPAYLRRAGGKGVWPMPTLLPHELLRREMEGENIPELLQDWEAPPNFLSHPVVRECQGQGKPVIPLSLFIDGVAYAKRDALLVVSICNLLTDTRMVLCVLRKRLLCKCSCRGWETIRSMFEWLHWSLCILRAGRCPTEKHDGAP